MKRTFTLNYTRKVKVTVMVILALFALSFFVSYQIRDMEEKAAWASLNRSADRLNEELTRRINIDQEVLLTLADIINQYEHLDSPEVQALIDGFHTNTLMEHVGLLLPGDRIMFPNKPISYISGYMSFREEAAKGMHITDRMVDLRDEGHFVLRNFVPIKRNGETVGMLYGVVNLQNLPALMKRDLYQGRQVFVVIDGKTGEFILNTQRQNLGNMWAANERQVKSGDSHALMMRKINEGEIGRTIVKSDVSHEYVCFLYKPASINDWRVAISVPEHIAFQRVYETNRLLLVFLIGEFILLLGYFLWLERTSRRELDQQQRLAERDLLTGCLNRNCYENKLKELELNKNHISCIYLDVNGLHELNNTQGHAAGDKMLQVVAALTRAKFGDRNVYRIGGDEFVVLSLDLEDVQVEKSLKVLVDEIHKEGYFVSVGHAHSHGEHTMDELIKTAEMLMYEDKRRFYSQHGRDRRKRS
ncbi:MAG: diguanylate cyclase domain-containing protein [Phascolarctobacterium sp.]